MANVRNGAAIDVTASAHQAQLSYTTLVTEG